MIGELVYAYAPSICTFICIFILGCRASFCFAPLLRLPFGHTSRSGTFRVFCPPARTAFHWMQADAAEAVEGAEAVQAAEARCRNDTTKRKEKRTNFLPCKGQNCTVTWQWPKLPTSTNCCPDPFDSFTHSPTLHLPIEPIDTPGLLQDAQRP